MGCAVGPGGHNGLAPTLALGERSRSDTMSWMPASAPSAPNSPGGSPPRLLLAAPCCWPRRSHPTASSDTARALGLPPDAPLLRGAGEGDRMLPLAGKGVLPGVSARRRSSAAASVTGRTGL
jgi:hypothetical protein